MVYWPRLERSGQKGAPQTWQTHAAPAEAQRPAFNATIAAEPNIEIRLASWVALSSHFFFGSPSTYFMPWLHVRIGRVHIHSIRKSEGDHQETSGSCAGDLVENGQHRRAFPVQIFCHQPPRAALLPRSALDRYLPVKNPPASE
jgi:hypothetical protein